MLYFVAIGPVRGFALTLMIGIACDIVMMVLFKRPILVLLAESVIAQGAGVLGRAQGTGQRATRQGSEKGGVAGV